MKNNQAKFDYIVSHWELRDGVIYSKRTGKPLVSSATNASGRHRYRFKINGKKIYMYIHDAIWTLYNNRPMPDGWFVIHHIDLNPANNAPDNLILMSHRMHRSYHHYINGGKGYTYTTAASCRLNPWQAQVSLPIGRRITKHFATEAEAAAFVAYHRAPIIKAFQAMGLPLPQTNDESTPQASRTIPPVRQSEMR